MRLPRPPVGPVADPWGRRHEPLRPASAAGPITGPRPTTAPDRVPPSGSTRRCRQSESAWLDDHLAGCPACLATAEAYEADRLALRSLGATMPEPPRDLWARTSAGIEQAAAGQRRLERTSRRRPVIAQFGAIAGLAVVAVLVGSSVLSGAWLDGPIGTTNGVDGSDGVDSSVAAIVTPIPTDIAVVPGATPIAVDAGSVGWFDVGADGSYAYNVAAVDEVCAEVDQASCAALADGQGERVALATAPKSIITSPSSGPGRRRRRRRQRWQPGLRRRPAGWRHDRPGEPDPDGDARTDDGRHAGSGRRAPTTPPDASPSTDPATASGEPSVEPTVEPTVEPSVEPTLSPSPTAAALAIVSGVTVVGDAAAFSPDGTWFAFTARPADGSTGPDIYVWRVGDARAQAITTDHASAFGSWAAGQVIGSRPGQPLVGPEVEGASPQPTAQSQSLPVLFSIDPSSGVETVLPNGAWRPAVDPTGSRAVSWDGTVAPSADGTTVTLTAGRLVLDAWDDGATQIDPDAYSITDGSLGDFTVRWDETGTWLAVWVAGVSDPSVGRLSLLHIDPTTGDVERPKAGPQDVLALPGFSIENGRLAWATPPEPGRRGQPGPDRGLVRRRRRVHRERPGDGRRRRPLT